MQSYDSSLPESLHSPLEEKSSSSEKKESSLSVKKTTLKKMLLAYEIFSQPVSLRKKTFPSTMEGLMGFDRSS